MCEKTALLITSNCLLLVNFQNLKTELLALFEHHPSEVDSIELMLRRGIRILREGFIECDLFLAGHSSNMLVCIEKCRDSSICTGI